MTAPWARNLAVGSAESVREASAKVASHEVVGFEVEFLGAYVPLSIAATIALLRSG
jgi:hypothetical protein